MRKGFNAETQRDRDAEKRKRLNAKRQRCKERKEKRLGDSLLLFFSSSLLPFAPLHLCVEILPSASLHLRVSALKFVDRAGFGGSIARGL
jgi:hypothetical protein